MRSIHTTEPRCCASSRHFVPANRAWGWMRAVGLEGDFSHGPLPWAVLSPWAQVWFSQAKITGWALPDVPAQGPGGEREARSGESRRAAKIKNSLQRSHVVISQWRRVKYSVWFNIWWKYPKPHGALPPAGCTDQHCLEPPNHLF